MNRSMNPLRPPDGLRAPILFLGLSAVLLLFPPSRGFCDTAPSSATTSSATASSTQPARPGAARSMTSRLGGLEGRIQVLTRELGLSNDQQRKIRLLLTQQRDEVHRIWSSGTVPPAERAPATRATNEQVGDEIRAVLNDDQKKKYNSVKPPTDRAAGERRSVDQWLESGVAH